MDQTLQTALQGYMQTFPQTLTSVLPWVISAAGGLLVIKLGIGYAVGFFRRFSR